MSSGDMTLSAETPDQAKAAVQCVFCEHSRPARVLTRELRELLAKWPGRTDQAATIALQLPADYHDLEREVGKDKTWSLKLTVCRVTILYAGRVVGHTIRTDHAGLAALELHERAWALHRARAH